MQLKTRFTWKHARHLRIYRRMKTVYQFYHFIHGLYAQTVHSGGFKCCKISKCLLFLRNKIYHFLEWHFIIHRLLSSFKLWDNLLNMYLGQLYEWSKYITSFTRFINKRFMEIFSGFIIKVTARYIQIICNVFLPKVHANLSTIFWPVLKIWRM